MFELFQMKIMKKINYLISLVIIATSFMSVNAFSQDHEEDHHHHHKNNEISVAAGVVPLDHENEVAPGLHFHYIRGIAFDNKLGIGAGFETILDEHKHYTFSVVFQYRIIRGWSVAYGPGLMIIKEEENYESQFAQHFETAYEWDIGNFHIGPMAEVGVEPAGVHYMLGVHFGIDF